MLYPRFHAKSRWSFLDFGGPTQKTKKKKKLGVSHLPFVCLGREQLVQKIADEWRSPRLCLSVHRNDLVSHTRVSRGFVTFGSSLRFLGIPGGRNWRAFMFYVEKYGGECSPFCQ